MVHLLNLLAAIALTCDALVAIALLPQAHMLLQEFVPTVPQQVVLFHLGFNIVLALLFVGTTGPVGRLVERWLPTAPPNTGDRPRHLAPLALATPSLAISCAAPEALHQADVVETMLRGRLQVLRGNDLALAERLRLMDDTVDEMDSAIKSYLAQISREVHDAQKLLEEKARFRDLEHEYAATSRGCRTTRRKASGPARCTWT